MTVAMADIAEAQARQDGIFEGLEKETHELARCVVCGEMYVLGMMATQTECLACAQDVFDGSFHIIGRRGE